MCKKIFPNTTDVKGAGMNICFLQGQVISDVKFDFVYNSKTHISVVEFELESNHINSLYMKNKCINRVFAFDKIADEIYSRYEKDDFIAIVGCIENNGIRILEIY